MSTVPPTTAEGTPENEGWEELPPPSPDYQNTYAVWDPAIRGLTGPWFVYCEEWEHADWADAIYLARVLAIVAKQVALLNSGIEREHVELFGRLEAAKARELFERHSSADHALASQEVPC